MTAYKYIYIYICICICICIYVYVYKWPRWAGILDEGVVVVWQSEFNGKEWHGVLRVNQEPEDSIAVVMETTSSNFVWKMV